jgi:hypothetical protein
MDSLFSVCCFDEKATFFFQIVSLKNRLFYQQPQRCSAFCEYNWKQKIEEYQNRSHKKTSVT